MTGAASLEEQIAQVQNQALAAIQTADSLDRLEAVRVDVLGRKGSLAQFSNSGIDKPVPVRFVWVNLAPLHTIAVKRAASDGDRSSSVQAS